MNKNTQLTELVFSLSLRSAMSLSSVFCFSFIFVIYSISYVYIYASFKCMPYLASSHTLFSQMMLRLDFASSQLSIVGMYSCKE